MLKVGVWYFVVERWKLPVMSTFYIGEVTFSLPAGPHTEV